MNSNHPFRSILLLILVSCTLLMGCSTLRHASYKENYIHQQLDSYTYNTSIDNLWSAARSLLFQKGFYVRGGGRGYVMETEWGVYDTNNTYRRYLVTGYYYNDGSSAIHFDYYEETHPDGFSPYASSGRDYDMEYELLRRVDSQAWSNLERAAEAYATQKNAK